MEDSDLERRLYRITLKYFQAGLRLFSAEKRPSSNRGAKKFISTMWKVLRRSSCHP